MSSNFEKIGIIGYGLIGSSIGKSIHTYLPHCQLTVFDPNQSKYLNTLPFVTVANDLQVLISTVDLIIIAAPLHTYNTIFKQLKSMSPQCLVTDIGSTKYQQVQLAQHILGEQFKQYIPSHPMAGNEKSGPENAMDNFLTGKTMVMCPTVANSKHSAYFLKLKHFWEQLQAKVCVLDAKTHDELLAITSHMPHLLAYLNTLVLFKNQHPRMLDIIAGGYLDTTRIAKSNAGLWSDIFCQSPFLLNAIEQLENELSTLKTLINTQNTAELINTIEPVTEFRKNIEANFHETK